MQRSLSIAVSSVLALMVICSGSAVAQDMGASQNLSFQLGDPVTEAGTAVVLTTDGAEKTVTAEKYSQRLEFQQSLQPRAQGRMPQGERAAQIHRKIVQSLAEEFALENSDAVQAIEVNTADVNERFRQIRAQFPDSSAYRQELERAGMTEDSLRSILAMRMRMQTFRQKIAEDAAASLTDAAVEEYALENPKIGASHILIQVRQDVSATSVRAARTAAAALIDSVEAGTPFADLAERHSDAPSSKQGGYLGTFTREGMQTLDELAEAAFTLESEGDVYPEPVRTRYGFHVIQLTTEEEPMARDEARSRLAKENEQDAWRAELNRSMPRVTVRVNPEVVPVSLADDGGESDGDDS